MKTKLLDDFPSGVDEIGGHDRIAKAISNLIIEEKGGKSIAISGDYGSGKSTVIKLLEKKLRDSSSKKNKYHLFIYDTWRHQTDPTRRSFIEELHFFLKNEKLIGNEFDTDIEIIQKKKTITNNTTEPKLTIAGRIAALFTFFAPIVLLAMAKIIENLFDSSGYSKQLLFMDSSQWFAVLFITFWIVPLLILLISHLVNRGEGESDLFNVFISKTLTSTKSEISSNPDPTSIEFRKLLIKIIDGALTDSKSSLVIVIDNLDRLSEDSSINVWSGLISFLNQESLKFYKSHEKVWVIAPFDFKKTYFDKNHFGDEADFIDKVFQVVFKVSKPLMVEWKKFLIEGLKLSLPSISETDSHTIYRLFQILYTIEGRKGNPTPRVIKRFINDLNALVRTWRDEKPLSILALYCLVSSEFSRSYNKIEYLKQLDRQRITVLINYPEWKKELLSIHYNTDANKVVHTLLTEEIMPALKKGKRGIFDLDKIKGFEGFWETLEHLMDSLHASDTDLFFNTVELLENLSTPRIFELTLWRDITQKLIALEHFGYIRSHIGDSLITIIEKSNDKLTVLKKVIDLFSNFGNPEVAQDDITIESWGESIHSVFNHFKEDNESRSLFEYYFKVPFGLHDYIKILGVYSLERGDSEFVRCLKTEIQFSELIEELIKRLHQNDYTYYQSSFIPFLKWIFEIESSDLFDLIEQIYSKIDPKNSQSETSIGSYMETLIFLEIYYQKDQSLSIDNYGKVNEEIFIWAKKYENDPITFSRILIFKLLTMPHMKNEFMGSEAFDGSKALMNFLDSPNDEELLDELVQFLTKHNISAWLLDLFKEYKYQGIAEIIKRLATNKREELIITSDIYKENYDLFKEILSEQQLIKLKTKLSVN